jgi:hypoxanthine phosphoribosyltransferase
MMAWPQGVRVLLSAETLAARVKELGTEIARAHPEGELVVVSVMKGSFIFAADLSRAIPLPLRIEFLGLSSYGKTTQSSGVVRITQDLGGPIEGCHVLIVEDIIDTGLTMAYLLENLATRKPASLRVCALLAKPTAGARRVQIDHLGFTIEDSFVVGYGLDQAEHYRNLPYVGVLELEGRAGG